MSVIANSNKEILWDVLNGLIQENNFHLPNLDSFQSYFEDRCKHYHKIRFDFDGLNSINKKIVADCFEYLSKQSHNNSLVMFREYKNFGNKNIVKNMEVSKRYTDHENNFKKMMTVKRPTDINFSEETDEPIADMDGKLNEMMKQRNQELNTIASTYDKDDIRWLTTGEVPKLKIENDNVELEVEEIKKKKEKKRVKFESQIIDSVNNYELGKTMAERYKSKLRKNIENQIVNNMEKDYQEPTEIMVKQFHEMNNNINKISKENENLAISGDNKRSRKEKRKFR